MARDSTRLPVPPQKVVQVPDTSGGLHHWSAGLKWPGRSALGDDDLLAFPQAVDDLGVGVTDQTEQDLNLTGRAIRLQHLHHPRLPTTLDRGRRDHQDVVDRTDHHLGLRGQPTLQPRISLVQHHRHVIVRHILDLRPRRRHRRHRTQRGQTRNRIKRHVHPLVRRHIRRIRLLIRSHDLETIHILQRNKRHPTRTLRLRPRRVLRPHPRIQIRQRRPRTRRQRRRHRRRTQILPHRPIHTRHSPRHRSPQQRVIQPTLRPPNIHPRIRHIRLSLINIMRPITLQPLRLILGLGRLPTRLLHRHPLPSMINILPALNKLNLLTITLDRPLIPHHRRLTPLRPRTRRRMQIQRRLQQQTLIPRRHIRVTPIPIITMRTTRHRTITLRLIKLHLRLRLPQTILIITQPLPRLIHTVRVRLIKRVRLILRRIQNIVGRIMIILSRIGMITIPNTIQPSLLTINLRLRLRQIRLRIKIILPSQHLTRRDLLPNRHQQLNQLARLRKPKSLLTNSLQRPRRRHRPLHRTPHHPRRHLLCPHPGAARDHHHRHRQHHSPSREPAAPTGRDQSRHHRRHRARARGRAGQTRGQLPHPLPNTHRATSLSTSALHRRPNSALSPTTAGTAASGTASTAVARAAFTRTSTRRWGASARPDWPGTPRRTNQYTNSPKTPTPPNPPTTEEARTDQNWPRPPPPTATKPPPPPHPPKHPHRPTQQTRPGTASKSPYAEHPQPYEYRSHASAP